LYALNYSIDPGKSQLVIKIKKANITPRNGCPNKTSAMTAAQP